MTQTIPGSSAARSDTTATQATQELISGGHLVAKALKAEGVDTIFTLRGGHVIDIYDGCVDEGISVIDVRHEQVAATVPGTARAADMVSKASRECDELRAVETAAYHKRLPRQHSDASPIDPSFALAAEHARPDKNHEPDDVQVTAFSAVGRAGI